jgi:polar amino acid transport system substrate-binding protein
MTHSRRLLLLCLLAAAMPAALAAQALSLCYNKDGSYPWLDPNREGLALRQARLIGERLGMAVALTSMPGPRCLQEVKSHHYDGAIAMSFREERREYGRYPEAEPGRTNPAKRMFSDQFVLVRPKGSKVVWDGQTMQPPTARIAAAQQVSVVATLRALGLAVDDGTKTTEATMRKVVLQRADVAVLLVHGVNFNMARFPELAEKLEIAGPPVEEKNYYLLLDYKLNDALARRIWDACEQVRDSPEYAQQQKAFFNGQ